MLQERVIPSINANLTANEVFLEDEMRFHMYRMKLLAQSNVRRKNISKFGGKRNVDIDVAVKESILDILLQISRRDDITCNSTCPFVCPKINLRALADQPIKDRDEYDVCGVCPKIQAVSEDDEAIKKSKAIIETLKGMIDNLISEEKINVCPYVFQKICDIATARDEESNNVEEKIELKMFFEHKGPVGVLEGTNEPPQLLTTLRNELETIDASPDCCPEYEYSGSPL